MQEQWISVGGVYGKIANYVAIGVDVLAKGPPCPVCGRPTRPRGMGGFMDAYQSVCDIISGYKPEHICMNFYPNPKYNPNKKMSREPALIPCPNHYTLEWNPALKAVVPKAKSKYTFYRPFAPGFKARKVTKI